MDPFFSGLLGIFTIEKECFADELYQLAPGGTWYGLGGTFFIDTAVCTDFHLDEFMVVQLCLDGLEDTVVYAFFTDQDKWREFMAEATKVFCLFLCKWQRA